MPLTFIHTSDWHLGRAHQRIGPNAASSRLWRVDAVRRVFDLATREQAAFILVAGDVFQSATPRADVIEEAVSLLRDAPVPTILIPGNHDPIVEGSVWTRTDFANRLAGLPNVVLALKAEPIDLAANHAVIFPCPVTSKQSPDDASAWIPNAPRGGTRYRIGLAHGAWQSYDGREYFHNFIGANRANIAGLDYLALGDFHSYTLPDHPAAGLRSWYSGTTECTAVDEARPGFALLVTIPTPGDTPVVAPHRVGRVRPVKLAEFILSPGSGFDQLRQQVQAIEHPEDVILGLTVAGALSAAEMEAFDEWANGLLTAFLGVDLNRGGLLIEPSDADFEAMSLDSSLARVVELLRTAPAEAFADDGDTVELYRALAAREDVRREATALFYRYLKSEA